MDLAAEMASIATGVPEGIQVARLIAADALNIPLNQPPGVNITIKASLCRQGWSTSFNLGSMKFTPDRTDQERTQRFAERMASTFSETREQGETQEVAR